MSHIVSHAILWVKQESALVRSDFLVYPFGTLSFLARPVIPALTITDQGLFDVTSQQFIRL